MLDDRDAPGRIFLAKAVFDTSTTRALVERLRRAISDAAGAFGWSLQEFKGMPRGELFEYARLAAEAPGPRLADRRLQ